MTIDEMIVCLQALKEGKKLEYRDRRDSEWHEAKYLPDFGTLEYRVKPEPREFWINYYRKHLGAGTPVCIPHYTREDADHHAGAYRTDCIHVREVVE